MSKESQPVLIGTDQGSTLLPGDPQCGAPARDELKLKGLVHLVIETGSIRLFQSGCFSTQTVSVPDGLSQAVGGMKRPFQIYDCTTMPE